MAATRTMLPDERQPPLYFAGRKDELGELKAELDAMCATGRAPGGLKLIHGVPGVGKTQLAVRYSETVAGATISGVTVRTRIMGPGVLSDTVSLFRSICEAVGSRGDGDKIAQVGDKTSGVAFNAGAATLKIGAGVTLDVGRHTNDLETLLRQSQDASLWAGKALVLIVDELQYVDADGLRGLSVLHANPSNCPIQILGFGLRHTPRVLANPRGGGAGISRTRPPIELQPLSHDDACDAIEGNLDAMGHLCTYDVPRASTTALATASFGFPQHIRGYLQGADTALRKHGHLQGAALQEAVSIGDAARAAYYDLRLRAMDVEASKLFPLVEHMESSQLKNVTRGFAEQLLGERVVDAAMEHGILVDGDRDTMEFAIPSFRTYMIDRASAHRGIVKREQAARGGD